MRAICIFLFVIISTGAVALDGVIEKKRVLIFSAMSDLENDAFYALLEQTNPNIDGSFRPKSLYEADTVVYLLNSWDDAESAPGADDLPQVFESIYEAESPVLSRGTFVDLGDEHSLHFVFYSLFDGGYAPLKCFALDLAVEVERELGDQFQNNAFGDCANK